MRVAEIHLYEHGGNRVLVDDQGVFCCSLGVGVEANMAAAGVASCEPGKAGDSGGLDARMLGWFEKEEEDEAEQNAGTHAVARHVRLFESLAWRATFAHPGPDPVRARRGDRLLRRSTRGRSVGY